MGAALSEVHWQELERAIRRFRAPLLDGLPTGVTWYRAELSLDDLAVVRIIPFEKFHSAGPAYTVRSLAVAVETQKAIDDRHFIANVATLQAEFEMAQMRGRPVIVADAVQGPYTLLEGYSRCCATVLTPQNDPEVFMMPVFLGVSARAMPARQSS
jgi:hypothetical protein